MAFFTLSKDSFYLFVDALINDFKVFGPKPKENAYIYDEISDSGQLSLDFVRTILPAKKLFFPPKETLFSYKDSKMTAPNNQLPKKHILIGPHPCDINGIKALDYAFSQGVEDSYYNKKRKNTLIIGSYCKPDEYCFCKSLKTGNPTDGFDLFVTDLGKFYLIQIGTDEGAELLKRYADKAAQADESQLKAFNEFEKARAGMFTAKINTDAVNLPLLYTGAFYNQVWKKYGDICLSCGTCNLVCPTCYCFDIKEDIELNANAGTRARVWDGCQLEPFAVVATGENFRKTPDTRVRHRLYRKFKYLVPKYGSTFCTGCGRCGSQCLVHINPVSICNELLETN